VNLKAMHTMKNLQALDKVDEDNNEHLVALQNACQ
jgi:hypothetical protein